MRTLVLVTLCVLLPGVLLPACAAPEPRRAPTAMVAPSFVAAPSPAAPQPDVFTTGIDVAPEAGGWVSWSLRDRADGRTTGSANAGTERTNAESSIKAWIALDTVRLAAEAGRPVTAAERRSISDAIRTSDDDAAERLYRAAGADRVLRDLKPVCGVDLATSRRGYWSYAQITAQDAVRILDCVLDRAPSYPGGAQIVDDLRSVIPENAFGIPAALPPGTSFAVKNGWTQHGGTGLWNVNCVASWSHYTLAVLTRYSSSRPLEDGAAICRDVATAVLAKLPG